MKKLMGFIAVWLLASCSSSSVISSWTKPNVNPEDFKSFMVIALVGQNNVALQQTMEEGMVTELTKRGYKATSFFKENGPRALDLSSEQAALKQLSRGGEDAILSMVLLDTAKEHYYVPGRVDYAPYGYYYRFWGYYGTVYDRIYTPGYYTTTTNFFWETNVYRTGNEELVYSVRTESFDPSSANNLAHQFGKLIVKDMARGGVISSSKKVK
jgi:hypothetical protein